LIPGPKSPEDVFVKKLERALSFHPPGRPAGDRKHVTAEKLFDFRNLHVPGKRFAVEQDVRM
jgi:hypothetical protein